MFCFCRIVRHVLSAKNINKRNGAYFLQSLPRNHIHKLYSTKENPENVLQDRGPLAELFRDIRSSEVIWRKNQHTIFKAFLKDCFKKSDISSSYAVKLLRVVCDDSVNFSSDMISYLLLEFNKYLDDNGIEITPTNKEQREALNCVLISRNYDIMPVVCTLLKINSTANYVKEIVDELVQHQKLIEAAYCIGALHLQHAYEIEKIVIPLLLNGKVLPVTACLRNHPDLQLKIAKELDALLGNTSPKESKRAKKALDAFIKYFKIPPEQCKHLFYIRGRSAINHLIKRRFQQSILQITFEDMIMSILNDNPELKEHLIFKLVQANDKDLALKMMKDLKMTNFDINSIPVSKEMVSIDDIDEGDEKDEENHLALPLNISDIKFVGSIQTFSDFLNDITKNYSMLGIDSEWKPHFGLTKDRLSLIQIAVHDKVYILDVIALSDCLSTDDWDKLNEDIFGNPNIVKLGCEMLADIQMIVNFNKGTTGKRIRFSHILDMVLFYEKLKKLYPETLEAEQQSDKSMGLSKLCETVLGKPLNKEERLCDWEKRPLSETQLEYAALDAYCLLQIYDKLKEMSLEHDMNFELQAKNSMVLTAAQCKPKKGLNELKKLSTERFRKRTPIQKFRVAVPSGLKQQGDQLQKLGADVIIFEDSVPLQDIVQIVEKEKRILFCSEELHEQAQNKLPPWMCFKSPTALDNYVAVSNLLQRFNIFIPSNTVSPCKVCNSKETLQLSPEQLNVLQSYAKNKTLTQKDDVEQQKLHETLTRMKELGIEVKFSSQNNSLVSETFHKHFCTTCGTVQ
ncbi:hypothetical protein JTE90_013304 [Oedothorax gibbosus]|uniref:3'-5' exonuclease domain-containing protein n=1 Tax=Oedothorax gibbosus TaxID=931172 RepID=A0AAV6VD73_9ARAC|nr:hypothetical protein JTE90_013304 [Oedothorax gibbosus]